MLDAQSHIVYTVVMPSLIRIRRLKALAESLRGVSPSAAWDLISMIEAMEEKPQPKSAVLRESLPSALAVVSKALAPIDWALIGGLAVIHWINVRPTYDLDILCIPEDLEKIKNNFVKRTPNQFGFSTEVEGVNVDFIDASKFSYADEAIRNAVTSTELGQAIKVVKPEYLILFKLDSMREKDHQDAYRLLTLSGVPDKARALVKRLLPHYIDDLEQAIAISQLEL